MGFYEQISKYYDDIFPVAPAAGEFCLRLFTGIGAVSILDIACGSGGYVKYFQDKGFQSFGIDLDEAMVEKAREKTSQAQIKKGDMTKVSELYDRRFDGLLCIGNSLVHLNDEETMLKALTSFRNVLTPGGAACIQIINYDRILDQHAEGLPTIEKPEAGLTFERKYAYDADKGMIHFNTVLLVPEGRFSNSIPLYPLRADSLRSLLARAGFDDINLYGDFKYSPWSPDSYATIATVRNNADE